jgi:uncharacterized membrane protein YvbJ
MKYCQNCGKEIPENASFCPECGAAVKVPASPEVNNVPQNRKVCPETHLALAIITTILCCLPLGAVGIIKASRVSTEFQAGNYEAALKNSADAKKWSIIAIIVGIVGILAYFALIVGAAVISEL